jgi:predicted O-methyltransferase YrrM
MNESPETIRATAIEVGVAELLDGLVCALEPELVVETGSFLGFGTYALGWALERNCHGRLVSCDVVEEYVIRSRQHCSGLGAPIEVRLARGIDLPELREADLVFVDSAYADRKEEVLATKPGAIVVVHDTLRSYDTRVEPLGDWVRSLGGICLPTERGLGILVRGART